VSSCNATQGRQYYLDQEGLGVLSSQWGGYGVHKIRPIGIGEYVNKDPDLLTVPRRIMWGIFTAFAEDRDLRCQDRLGH